MNETVRFVVVIAAHNEERYISRCLGSVLIAMRQPEIEGKIIVVADRCSDRTVEIAQKHGSEVIVKNSVNWQYPYAEALEFGLKQAVNQSDYLTIVDADVVIPPELFRKGLETLKLDPTIAYVTPQLATESSTWFNTLYRVYERLIAPVRLTEGIRGACRIYRASALQEIKQNQHILADVVAPDTYLDLKVKGRRVILRDLRALHIRETSLRRSIQGQIQAGRARRQLGVSFGRTLLHSIFRLRFFVLYGYLRASRAS